MLGTTEQALRGQDDAINGGSFPLSSFWLITFLVLKNATLFLRKL